MLQRKELSFFLGLLGKEHLQGKKKENKKCSNLCFNFGNLLVGQKLREEILENEINSHM